MKKRLRWAGLTLIALLHTAMAQAAVVSWLPSVKETGVGELGFIDLLFNRTAGDTGPLGAFDVLLQFNPTVIRFDAAASSLSPAGRENTGLLPDQLSCPGLPTICTYWSSLGDIIGQTDDDDGTIELREISLAPSSDLANQARGFLLLRLAFEGRALGTTDLDILRIDLSDANGSALGLVTAPSARFAVVIPEPASTALVVVALLGCAFLTPWVTRSPAGPRATGND